MTGDRTDSIMTQMRNILDGVQAVLFDMDGTLVETDIDYPRMRQEMLALSERYGLNAEQVRALDILGVVDFVVERLQSAGDCDLADKARRQAFDILEEIELAACATAVPVSGSLELIDTLHHAGYKIGIVTRNCSAAVQLSMERTGIRGDILLTRDDVTYTKPHPEQLLLALDLLGVPSHRAVMVGDHWMDVIGGKAAGTRTIGFLRSDKPSDFFNRVSPDLVIRSLGELMSCVERLKV